MSTIVLQAPIKTTVSRVMQMSKKYSKEDAKQEAKLFIRLFIVRYGNSGKRIAFDFLGIVKTEVGYVARCRGFWDSTSAVWDFPILRITDTTTDPPTTTLGIWDFIHHLIVFHDVKEGKRVEYKLPEHIVGKVQSGEAVRFCFRTQRVWVDGEKVGEESLRLPEFQKEAPVEECTICSGTGEVEEDCEECDDGMTWEDCEYCWQGYVEEQAECPECVGSGEVIVGETCEYCDGSGELTEEEECPECDATGEVEQACFDCGGEGFHMVSCSCKDKGEDSE